VLLLVACGVVAPGGDRPGGDDSASGGAPDCEYTQTGSPAKPVELPPSTGVPQTGTATVTLTMTEGPVTITLDRDRAPCTVNSFLSLARQGFYTGTRCHRLIDNGTGVLQCGDPTGSGSGGPGYSFADELSGDEAYGPGVVAMANAGPNTNGSQFFMVYEDFPISAKNYTVFGSLDETSRGTVARMGAEGQDGSNRDGSGRPNNPCAITAVQVG
jgi:cyclophilin family peptidyl-prolyl cis-trans isomerase